MRYLFTLLIMLVTSTVFAQTSLQKQLNEAEQRDRPFINKIHRSVGYMPIVTILPEGTNLSIGAIVSADRRYVRITTNGPMFSKVTKVTTFSFRR